MSMFDDFDEDDVVDAPDAGTYVQAAAGELQPPRLMSQCFGHEDVEKQLLGFLDAGQFPHALMFCGPEGIGKSTMAFRLARYLLTKGKPEDESAGGGLFGEPLPKAKPESLSVDMNEQAVRMISAGGHPDLLTVEREFDEKKGRFKGALNIDAVRKIAPFMRMTASYGGWRIAIVDDADTMTNQAQNAILKILEEPPANALLILICHRPGMMIPTIRSRCRTVHFQTLAKEPFSRLLRYAEPGLKDSDLETLHILTGGSAGQGARLIEEGGLEVIYKVSGLLAQWPSWDWPQIHGLADNLSKPGQEESYQTFLDVFTWAVQSVVNARARGIQLPLPLNSVEIIRMANHYSIEEWLAISDSLRSHFNSVDFANLDKRQAILGAFSIFDEARKAA